DVRVHCDNRKPVHRYRRRKLTAFLELERRFPAEEIRWLRSFRFAIVPLSSPLGPTNPIRSPRLTWSDTSSKSARPAKDFESCETVSIAESAQCCLVRWPAQLVLRDQRSLYSKIDIFIRVHGKPRPGVSAVENKC